MVAESGFDLEDADTFRPEFFDFLPIRIEVLIGNRSTQGNGFANAPAEKFGN